LWILVGKTDITVLYHYEKDVNTAKKVSAISGKPGSKSNDLCPIR
jgi:hypothetical protein